MLPQNRQSSSRHRLQSPHVWQPNKIVHTAKYLVLKAYLPNPLVPVIDHNYIRPISVLANLPHAFELGIRSGACPTTTTVVIQPIHTTSQVINQYSTIHQSGGGTGKNGRTEIRTRKWHQEHQQHAEHPPTVQEGAQQTNTHSTKEIVI